MDTAICMQQGKCIHSPFHTRSRRPLVLPNGASASFLINHNNAVSSRWRNMCSAANSDTLVAASGKADKKSVEVVTKKEEEHADLKSWMHKNGLPPCKVVLKDRPSHDSKHHPIHYIASSEDLQEGEVPFLVPNSLVVTLETVLGNGTVAELFTTNKLSELACLALYLMYEKKQGKKSFWYPYIRELDRQRGRGQLAVESPLLWSEAEVDYLTGSPTKFRLKSLPDLKESRESTMNLIPFGLWLAHCFSNIHMTYPQRLFLLRFSSKLFCSPILCSAPAES